MTSETASPCALNRCRVAVVILLPAIWSCERVAPQEREPAGTADGAGVLTVQPARLEFAAVEGTDTHSSRVELRLVNTGTGPLRIGDVEAHCGCTVPEDLPRDFLPVGQSEVLAVSVSPPRYGKRETSLTVKTDSRETPRVVVPVVLHGPKLHPPYVASAPAPVSLTGGRPGEPIQQEILIRTVEAPGPAWVTGLVATQETIEPRLIEVASEEPLAGEAVRRVYRFAIRCQAPDSPQAVITDTLTIATGPALSRKRIPDISVAGHLTPVIRTVPHEVHFHLNGDATFPMERLVLLLASDDAQWSYSLPEHVPSWLEVVAEPPAGSGTAGVKRLRVRINESVRDTITDDSMPHSEFVPIACRHPECDLTDMTIVLSP